MSDLISRSELIEQIKKYKFGAISNDAEREYVKETILNFIEFQPTAYKCGQVAEWLEELKSNKVTTAETYEQGYIRGYNKAIDDFVKSLQKLIEKDLSNPMLMLECKKCGIWKNYDIEHIAEQLKAGASNGTDNQ